METFFYHLYETMNNCLNVNWLLDRKLQTPLWFLVLGYGLDDQKFESRQGLGILLFTTASTPDLDPTQPPVQWLPAFSDTNVYNFIPILKYEYNLVSKLAAMRRKYVWSYCNSLGKYNRNGELGHNRLVGRRVFCVLLGPLSLLSNGYQGLFPWV